MQPPNVKDIVPRLPLNVKYFLKGTSMSNHKPLLHSNYIPIFNKYATEKNTAGFSYIPVWNILPFTYELLHDITQSIRNITIIDIALRLGIHSIVKNTACQLLSSSQYGVFLLTPDNRSIIIYDDTMKLERIRFKIAHEIGHFALHSRSQVGIIESTSSATAMEHEADLFAGTLLYFMEIHKQPNTALA